MRKNDCVIRFSSDAVLEYIASGIIYTYITVPEGYMYTKHY